jgi:hypothetical protein
MRERMPSPWDVIWTDGYEHDYWMAILSIHRASYNYLSEKVSFQRRFGSKPEFGTWSRISVEHPSPTKIRQSSTYLLPGAL